MPRCSPTVPGSAIEAAASRASSTAARRVASSLGAGTQDSSWSARPRSTLASLSPCALSGRRPRRSELETSSSSLMMSSTIDDELLGRLAALLALAGGHARGRLEERDRQRLRAAAALDDAELDARAALERGDTLGQGVGVQEHVTALVVGEEAEALLRVVPLDLACRHCPPLARKFVCDGASSAPPARLTCAGKSICPYAAPLPWPVARTGRPVRAPLTRRGPPGSRASAVGSTGAETGCRAVGALREHGTHEHPRGTPPVLGCPAHRGPLAAVDRGGPDPRARPDPALHRHLPARGPWASSSACRAC